MILVADGGSTKCDWVLFDRGGLTKLSFRTRGLNPAMLREEEIEKRLLECRELSEHRHKVEGVHFYGAGCGTAEYRAFLGGIFSTFFPNASRVEVREDLVGAVYGCTTTPGVVAILGTGSNCCFYNGSEIEVRMPSLGYVLMDDGSGNHLGRLLLKALYYNRLPGELEQQLKADEKAAPERVRHGLYNSDHPNAFLASFAPFVLENLEHPSMQILVKEAFVSFIDTHLGFYREECLKFPIHFVGSVAFHAREILSELLEDRGMKAGKFIRRPIDGLLEHHLNSV